MTCAIRSDARSDRSPIHPVRFRFWISILASVLSVAAFLGAGEDAEARVSLDHSAPGESEIVSTLPSEITLYFTEAVAPDSVSIWFIDAVGQRIDGSSFSIPSPDEVVAVPPPGLENGTYSVFWQVRSAVDGDASSGYVPLTIGSAADIEALTIPAQTPTPVGSHSWMRAIFRWLVQLAVFAAIVIWPFWRFALTPILDRATPSYRAIAAGLQRFSGWIFLSGLSAMILLLLAEASANETASNGFGGAALDVLRERSFGAIWIAQLLCLGVWSAALAFIDWERPAARRPIQALAWLAPLGALVPISRESHQWDTGDGRIFALTTQMIHLISAGIWVGTSIAVFGAGVVVRREVSSRAWLRIRRRLVRLYVSVSAAALLLLAITGAYLVWLDAGTLDALTFGAFSTAFKAKMLASASGLGGLILFAGAKRFRRVDRAVRRKPWLIFAGSSLALGLLLVIALFSVRLPMLPTARVLATDAATTSKIALEPSAQNGLTGRLEITPALAGPNHFAMTLTSPPAGLAPDASARLEVTSPDSAGNRTIPLLADGNYTWESHDTSFSFAGDWSVTVIVLDHTGAEWSAAGQAPIRAPMVDRGIPGPAWSFGNSALGGVILVLIGAGFAGWAWAQSRRSSRREGAGIATAGLVFGLLWILQARNPPVVTADLTLADSATLARGEAIYRSNCMACHGIDGRGDGPAAANLPEQPANFTDPIHLLHTTSELEQMVQNGIPATSMPSFGGVLTAQEIEDVIAYTRSLGINPPPEASPATEDPATPTP